MGGLGSGRWTRGNRRQTLDDVLQLDVRRLNKQGLLRAGQGGTITWRSDGEATGSIRFACTERARQARRFLSAHAASFNLFNLGRHLVGAEHYRNLRMSAFAEWSRAVA